MSTSNVLDGQEFWSVQSAMREQEGLQECCSGVHLCLSLLLQGIRSARREQEGLQECCRNVRACAFAGRQSDSR